MPISDPYTDLKKHLANGEVCPFVGAGMSVGAGLPGWYDLISKLSERIGYDMPPLQWATSEALIDAAQAYVNDQGLHSLVRFLKERLRTTGIQPTTAHKALARLPVSLVFTTNYDNLLEKAFEAEGKWVEVVVEDDSIPYMRRGPDTVNIVKLYGDLNQPDSLVLARQQYEEFKLKRPQMIKLLETELGRSDMLYLGWSHTDPYFNLVFGDLLSRFGENIRPGYAVMFDAPETKRKELARKHIRLVEFDGEEDRTKQLANWLAALKPGTTAPAEVDSGVIKNTDVTSAPPSTAQDETTQAEILSLEEQIKIRRHLLGKLQTQAILAAGRELAVLEIQIEDEQVAIKELERSIDALNSAN